MELDVAKSLSALFNSQFEFVSYAQVLILEPSMVHVSVPVRVLVVSV